MKRLPGITVSAIVLLLGSLLQLLFAFGAVSAGFIERSQINSGENVAANAGGPIPGWMPVFMYGLSMLLVALAAWGILTSIGLIRLRRWARYSVLIIGGCLLLFGLPSMLMMLVLVAVPLPLPPSVNASQAQTVHMVTRAIFGVVAVFYCAVCAIGIYWLVYFNRKKVREALSGAACQPMESRRPILISVVAVLSMIGGPGCLLLAFMPIPLAFFGFTVQGWEKAAVCLTWAVLAVAAGVGLWRLEEWGRRLAIVLQVAGLAQNAFYMVRPSLLAEYSAEMDRAMDIAQPQMPAQFQTMLYDVSFGFGIVLVMAVLWILIHYRGAFRPPDAPAQIASAA